jgi:hypothetical protein
MAAEFPGGLRDLFKLTIEQSRRAFETFVTTSEKTWKGTQASSPAGRGTMEPLMDKVAEITRANAEANFSLALELADSTDTRQAMELYTEHARKQMEAFARQFEEVLKLTTQLIKNSNLGQMGNISGSIAATGGDPVSQALPGKTASVAPTFDDGNSPAAQKQNPMEKVVAQHSSLLPRTTQQTADAPAVQTNVTAHTSSQTTSSGEAQPNLESPCVESLGQPHPQHEDYQAAAKRKSDARKGKKGKRHRNKS